MFEIDPVVFTVASLTQSIERNLKAGFSNITVEGEISTWTVAGKSGHVYFSLKDQEQNVLLKAVMWRSRREKLRDVPVVGLLVQVRGTITVYPPRGEYQLDVISLKPAGVGALQQRFEELKRRLEREGLFADWRKRPIPTTLRRVVVITSPTGAAIRDFLSTLKLQQTPVEVLIIPTLVQGLEAPGEVVRALQQAPGFSPDLVILTRGGGSLEDLWTFNEEMVARAIAGCPVPVLSAIGHQVDNTIADFVADKREGTPTAAAQFLADRFRSRREQFEKQLERLNDLVLGRLEECRWELEQTTRQLLSTQPLALVNQHRQSIDHWVDRASRLLGHRIAMERSTQAALLGRLRSAFQTGFTLKQNLVAATRRQLDLLHPQLALNRGFALLELFPEGLPVRSTKDIEPESELLIHLQDGDFRATARPNSNNTERT